MKKVSDGDKVRVHYTGTLDSNEQFDSSRGRDPLEFTMGKGQLIAGFENAVRGMSAGDSVKVRIPAAEAYGAHNEEMVIVVPRENMPPNVSEFLGQPVTLRSPDGGTFSVVVKEVTEKEVRLDGNHPLAGQDLTFEIEILEIL